ncbi:MAG TPA: hypothetical protein PKJ95_04335 [Atribacterota bacterium]|nr:hypothetical protein [Atribacterota bacterium]
MRNTEKEIKKACKLAVEEIIFDLSDRRGLRQEWEQIDDDIVEEIKEKWQEIIFNQFKEGLSK